MHEDRFAIITGKVTLAAASQQSMETGIGQQTIWQVDFPEGFNKNNCVCLNFGARFNTSWGFAYGSGRLEAAGMLTGDIPRTVQIGYSADANKIMCMAHNLSISEKVLEYRIILMKLPEIPNILIGDINGDGTVTQQDYQMALDYSVDKSMSLSLKQFKAGDVNNDGIIDARDASRILNIIGGA